MSWVNCLDCVNHYVQNNGCANQNHPEDAIEGQILYNECTFCELIQFKIACDVVDAGKKAQIYCRLQTWFRQILMQKPRLRKVEGILHWNYFFWFFFDIYYNLKTKVFLKS